MYKKEIRKEKKEINLINYLHFIYFNRNSYEMKFKQARREMIPHSKSPTISKLNIYDNAIEFLSDFKKPCFVSKS